MTTTHASFRIFLLAAGLALAAPQAGAEPFDAVRLFGAAPGADGGFAGAGVYTAPRYQGSDEHRTTLVPLLEYQWGNGWFAGFGNGLGYNFSNSLQWQYGLRLTVDKGREERRSAALRGMGNIDAAAEGGAFLNHALPGGLLLTSSARFGSGTGHRGLVVDLGANHLSEIAPGWHLNLGAMLTVANAHYMQSYFGVTSAQSTASGYAPYAAGAGARDLRANASISYALGLKASVTALVEAGTLLGDAKSSPPARKRTSESALLAFTYAF